MAAYLTFLLDLAGQGKNRIVFETLRFEPDPNRRPANAFIWRVTCDAVGLVTLRALDTNGALALIATAKWSGTLRERLQKGTTPTEYQWDLVQVALELASAARRADPSPYDDSLVEEISEREARALGANTPVPRSSIRYGRSARRVVGEVEPVGRRGRRKVIFATAASAGLFLVFGLVFTLAHVRKDTPQTSAAAPREPVATMAPAIPATPVLPPRPKTIEEAVASAESLRAAVSVVRARHDATVMGELPPGAELLANYRPRWSELEGASSTTIPRVEKDPAAERGAKLCATGEIEKITRRELVSGRSHYVGALRTAEGDRVVFLVAGSTAELVKRDQATLCGVVTGATQGHAAVIGMFDLPENRNPIVEAP